MTADALKGRTVKSIGRQTGFVLVVVLACVMGCGNTQQDSSSATPMTGREAGRALAPQQRRAFPDVD